MKISIQYSKLSKWQAAVLKLKPSLYLFIHFSSAPVTTQVPTLMFAIIARIIMRLLQRSFRKFVK